jgi:hypothetical protein
MCGRGVMSWVMNQRMAIRRFSSSGSQPLGPLRPSFRGPVGVLHERTEVLRVPLLDGGQVELASSRSVAQLSHGFQHLEPWPGAGRVDLHEAVPGECICSTCVTETHSPTTCGLTPMV